MESIVGKILCDRYRIIRELSQDDFSTVYVAEDLEEQNQPCHIEQLQPHYNNEVLGTQSWQRVLQTFVERGTVLKSLSQHPQIPQLLDFFECDREFYLVRECIEGESLAQKIERSTISEAEALSWLQELLGVLEFVHQAKIVHLNIQPSSSIEHQNGRKFLTDFATVKNAILGNSNSSPVIINPEFAAPELKLGRADYSSDIYALGKTITYALTGIIEPVTAQSSIAGASSARSNSLSTVRISPELASVLAKMTSHRPGDRYQTTAEVLADLDFNQNVVTFPPPFFDDMGLPVTNSARPKNILSSRFKIGRFRLSRKIIWLLSAFPFIVALGIIFIGINRNSYRNFNNYVNSDYSFAVKYPQNWRLKELNDPITGGIVVFTSPPSNDTDIFREKVYITVEYLATEITSLEQYTQTVLSRIQQTEGSNVEVYEEFTTSIDESPARTIIYSRQENGVQLKQMETFTIEGNQAYIAIYTAEADEFSEFSNTVQKIIDSWEIQ